MLLSYAEPNLGDTLPFIRDVPIFAARGTGVERQPALLPQPEGFAGVDEWFEAPVDLVPAADFQFPMMSAPGRVGPNPGDIP